MSASNGDSSRSYRDLASITSSDLRRAEIQSLLSMQGPPPSCHSEGSRDTQGIIPSAAVQAISCPSDGNFPDKLHCALSECDIEGLAHIVAWQPHGRCFLVLNQEEFIRGVLYRFFRQTKYASFQRQLNIYGFQRISRGPDKHAYYHELFLRGKPFLTPFIRRTSVKGTGPRQSSANRTEPSFYGMPSLPPTTATVDQNLPMLEGTASTHPTSPTLVTGMPIFPARFGLPVGGSGTIPTSSARVTNSLYAAGLYEQLARLPNMQNVWVPSHAPTTLHPFWSTLPPQCCRVSIREVQLLSDSL